MDQTSDIYKHSNLTRHQLLIWAGQRLEPNVPLYNMAYTFTISRQIDLDHLRKAFQILVNSCDTLRTVIHEVDGIPQQRILKTFQYDVQYIDFSQEIQPDSTFHAWVGKRCQIRFDLEECLFDFVLAKLSDNKYVLYFNQHHIVCDGWTFSLIFRRLSELYEHSLNGQLEERLDLPQFQDYVNNELEYRVSPQYLEIETYWNQKLSGKLAPIAFYGKVPVKKTTCVRRVACDLGEERTKKIKSIAVQEGIFAKTLNVSLFNIFATVFLTYIYRISGNRNLILGTPFHGRQSEVFKETMGLFMRVLPLRITIEEDDTFLTLMKKVAIDAGESTRRRQYAVGNPLHNQTYDLYLNFYPASYFDFQGTPVAHKWLHTGHRRESLLLQIGGIDLLEKFILYFDFHCDVFTTGQQDHAIQHFLQVLDAFIEDRMQSINRVNLLSDREKQRILVEFNQSETRFSKDQTISELFEEQVKKVPDRVAVVFNHKSLTYAQLNAKANQLAHHLRKGGGGAQLLAGICVERSLEMIVGVLGILKAGGAFVPLDPTDPHEYLEFVLADSRIPILLTQKPIAEKLPGYRKQVLCLDTDWPNIASNNEENLSVGVGASDLAYVIYTTGSTARPKGIQISHGSVVNLLNSMRQKPGLTEKDILLAISSVAFDMAILEIFLPLSVGARVEVISSEAASDGKQLQAELSNSKATVMQAKPAIWRLLLETGWRGNKKLKILCGRDVLDHDLADRLMQRCASLWNLYGFRETTIWSTIQRIKADDGAVSIGRPIANTQAYLLDKQLLPVPIGVPGDLYIGGSGLALGYLNRPELTAEKFIKNPSREGLEERIYKTGEMARYLPDGKVELLGPENIKLKSGDEELPILELPADYPRTLGQPFRQACQSLMIPEELSKALNLLCKQEKMTLFVTLLAAFKLLLHRLTGQEKIVAGASNAGRNRIELEGLIGFYLNTVVLCTDLSDNPSFIELAKRVHKISLQAFTHQNVPFKKLLEELESAQDLNRCPLFQVLFNMIHSPENCSEGPDATLEVLAGREGGVGFDLTIDAAEQDKGIRLTLVYNASLFGPKRMVEFLDQYKHLLTQIVANPDNPIRFYSLVTPEASSLLPDPAAEIFEPRYDLVTQVFTSWAKRMPEHPAVSQGSRIWSYQELAQSAQSLAKVLLAQGVQPGEPVAVCGSRSFGMIASMLGVFLSRAVLLTIDQNLPGHRQQIMLNEAKVKNVLYVGTQRPEDTWMWEALDIINVESETAQTIGLASQESFEKIDLPEVEYDDAAYIFFTSGTTGTPKGILGSHKGLAHFLAWQRQTFSVGPQDHVAQLTNLSFDAVLRDVFLPLTSGGLLCLPAEGDNREPSELLPWMEREQITILHIVPALLQSWLDSVPPRVSLRALRWVFIAGEPLKDTLVHQWRQAFPEAGSIVNLYGPTETTMVKCYFPVPYEICPGVQPIGSPMPETQALVLAKNNQLCGIGEPVEIVLRTPFRSLGYVNASEEDQQRFFMNPFYNKSRDLLYRTGDCGRYRPDSSLEILGRFDDQVKIHGIRIEPAEIEILLGQHPDVRQTFVIAREDLPGDKRLVSYVVAAHDPAPTVSELRRFLKKELPDYMIPSAFVMLDSMPLTHNGKVDRRALPAPDQCRSDLESTFVAPRTSIEEVLAGFWCEALGIERVGIYDDFFELGGHSLLGTRIISRIRDKFEVDLPLLSLFERPTVAEWSELIETVEWVSQGPRHMRPAAMSNREEGEL